VSKGVLYFLPAILWAILIYFLSTTSGDNLPKFNLLSIDKIGHLLFYAALTFWLLWAAKKNAVYNIVSILLAVSVAGLYGVALEWRQAFLPHRSFDYADMLANFMGCMLGLLSFGLCWRVSEKIFSFFFKKS
jgi:VanZ family protein